ncbi:hypothetical protein Tco_1144237 [Tanacetum coccineum]
MHTLSPPPSVSTIPPILLQTTTPIPTPLITAEAPTITTAVPESNALTTFQQLLNIILDLKLVMIFKRFYRDTLQNLFRNIMCSQLSSQARFIHQQAEKQESKKSALEIHKIKKEQAKKQKLPKYTIKSTDKATLKEYDLKKALYQTMEENKSFNKNPSNHALYHVLMEALIEDGNTMDKGVANTVKNHKRQHDDDEDDDKDTSARPNQGKKTKRRRTKESESSLTTTTKEPPETTANEDVVNDADRPQDYVAPKTNKPSRDTWFKQPPRPPTPDPEWNKPKDPLTFDELMVTPIDFSKYVINRLQIDNLTQEILVRLVYNLLKGTCRLAIAAEYFFNNDLEFLKSLDPEKKYTTSIMNTKAARYEIVGIENMVLRFGVLPKLGMTKTLKRESSIKVKGKLHGYGHLEEIAVRRADRQVYKFKEGDFVDLHLNDIEDMHLLVVQHKLFQLDGSDIVDLIVALRMFTRSLIIKRRVEDL